MSHNPGSHNSEPYEMQLQESRPRNSIARRIGFVFAILAILLTLVLPSMVLLFGPEAEEEMGALEVVAPLAPRAEPLALETPEDMRCRHNQGKTDQVLLQWDDTNDNNADYGIYREDINSPGWNVLAALLADQCEDGTCEYVDTAASSSTVYRYRVQAASGGDTSSFSDACREPIWQDDPNGVFRVFYRLQDCPDVDNKQNCTENINNGDDQNVHVMQMIETHDDFRQEYIDIGFKDYAYYQGNRPYPIDLYPCNNGCKNSQGIQIPPANLEETNYNPATGGGKDYEVFVVGHEAFHTVQTTHYGEVADPYYKWLIEGQARSTEDKSCIFANATECNIWDNEVDKYYGDAVASYLGFPEQGLLDASYIAALFWTYIVEQFGTPTAGPETGMDALVNYWEQNETNANNGQTTDGIGTLNDMLETMGSTRRFEDIFQDFAVANYMKEWLTDPAPAGFEKYNYVDEESYTLNGNTYDKVKLTEEGPMGLDEALLGTTSVQAWGARYFEVSPDPAVPSINIEVETLAATPHSLYYHVVMINNGAIVDQYSDVGTSFSYSVDNSADYDRVALIVASMDNPVNFTYGFNLTDGVFILSPTTQLPAAVGETTSPEKFILQLQVLDEVGDPVAGIDPNVFTVTVGSTVINPPPNPADPALIGATYLAGQYWLTLRAPADPGGCQPVCDLSVGYAAYSALEEDAILYGPKPDTDNMIIIDRSGSMLGEKIVAAQEAAKLYADSYSEGDTIGVLSFSDAPAEEYPLQEWTEDHRDDVAQAIDDIDTPAGNTANGAALREGNALLVGQSDPNPAWAIVLLSDGMDTVEDTNDHIPAYVSEWATAEDDGDQVPVVHVVAVGDDADGVELSKLTNKTGGQFQFLPVPSEMAAAADADGAEEINAVNMAQALSEIYRIFAEDVLDEQQTHVSHFKLQTNPHIDTIHVDSAASQGIFVVKYSPPDADIPTIFLLPPGSNNVNDGVPPTLTAPGHWLWRIPEPEAGEWQLGIRFGCDPCPQDYMVEAALVSDLTLNAFLGVPVEDRKIGLPMPIVAFLSDIDPLTGATVKALSETTGESITLHDDGMHGDGAANDGAYGGTLVQTNEAGGYSVVVDATGISPFAGEYTRRVRLGFFLPDAPDGDGDRLPDWWEIEHGTDPTVPDAGKDPDGDGLPNSQEYFRKTHPLDPDSDDGGENDGSEVGRGNDPLFPGDDGKTKPVTFKPWPGPNLAILRLALPYDVENFVVERSPGVGGPFTAVLSGTEPLLEWQDPAVVNDQPYCYRVIVKVGGASSTSLVKCTTPKSDPNPPHGVVSAMEENLAIVSMANMPAMNVLPAAVPLTVRLILDGEDDPSTEEHPAFDGKFLFPNAQISGVTEMMISNRADFAGATWEPYATSKLWTLTPNASNQAIVYVLFKDGAGNVSDVAHAGFTVDPTLPVQQPQIFLPRIGS